ncbi:MAG: hypothetical protein NTY50_05880 [Methylobacter sp.]|nr:hypothetical protein [Methylobacter sp.]
MKKHLKIFAVAVLSSASALSHAAPLNTGLYTAQLYNDATNNTLAQTWDVCIYSNGKWNIMHPSATWLIINGDAANPVDTGGAAEVAWGGKWLNKGNDAHFQSSIESNTAISFNVSRINSNLLTGYYSAITSKGDIQNMTMTLSRKKSSCVDNTPPIEIPIISIPATNP